MRVCFTLIMAVVGFTSNSLLAFDAAPIANLVVAENALPGSTDWQLTRVRGPFPESGPDEGLLMGARNVEPVNGGGDWICTNSKHWIFEGTGMKNGDKIPGLEIVGAGKAWVGGETPQQWTATVYKGPKGNVV